MKANNINVHLRSDKHLKATGPDGKVLFEGPINTEEEKAKVPAEILEKVDMMNVEVAPLPMQLDVDDMLFEILGGDAGINRARAQMEKMRKLIEQMGGEMPGGFDNEQFREMLESFGVDIPDLDPVPAEKSDKAENGNEVGNGKEAPKRKGLAHPKTIN